jgi:F-type H+-transporting ATPase subunit g
MSLPATRAVLRQTARLTGRSARRFESTTAKATEAAQDTASKASQTATKYKSKASEGLSRVTSSAGPAISGAAKSVGNALGRIGGRTGRLIAFVESVYSRRQLYERLHTFWNSIANGTTIGQIPPTIYYARVGLELSKLVFQGQKMTPP